MFDGRILLALQSQEEKMATLHGPLMAGLVLAAAATIPAAAQTVCLKNKDVTGASTTDGKRVAFHMRDGRIYINHLRDGCPSLKSNNFTWEIGETEDICEGEQNLRVTGSGEICRLGKFDPPLPPRAPVQ